MADVANELEEGGMMRTVKDLFAGAAGGIAQVLLGEFFSSVSFSTSGDSFCCFGLICLFGIWVGGSGVD